MKKVTDADQWDEALLALPVPHALQSWNWGAFKARHGWEPHRWLWEEGDAPVAAAQVLIQARHGLKIGYVTKGPITDWSDPDVVTTLLEGLKQLAHETSLLLLKIDPDVRADTQDGKAIQQLLRKRRWQRSFEDIQFCNTMHLDISPDLDTILMDMKSKWRYNIRLAARRGVEVREVKSEELPALYEMYEETAERQEFIIRDKTYYLDAWRTFIDAGLATPLVAEYDGDQVGMLILFHFGERAWYMYGASREQHREHMPNHRLQWEAIRHAKRKGCTLYDLWGAPDELNESDPLWGVYRFKKGFGAEFVPHIGAYDYAPNRLLYQIYRFLRPRLVNLAQRRHWTQKD